MGATGLARGRSHAIRPWPDWEAYEGKDGAPNKTPTTYFWQNYGTVVIEISGVVYDGDIITSRLFPKIGYHLDG